MHALGNGLIGIVGAVFLFGFAVLVHELGHFIVAKLAGVGVNKFAIGFGPIIWAFTWRGTEYSLRWIPVGGFVALKGMIEGIEEEAGEGPGAKLASEMPATELPAEPEKPKKSITEDLDALRNKPALVRIAVFTAGVFCNYLTAIFLTGILLWYGVPKMQPLPTVIQDVPPASSFYQAGWRSGDRIVKVAGRPVKNWNDVEEVLFGTDKTEGIVQAKDLRKGNESATTVTFTVQRGNQTAALPWTAAMVRNDPDVFEPPRPPVVLGIEPNSPADRARLLADNYKPGVPLPAVDPKQLKREPLKVGDTVLSINDHPVASWQEMQKLLEAHPDRPITLLVEREQKDKSRRLVLLQTTLEHRIDEKTKEKKGRVGIVGGIPEVKGERERKPFVQAFAEAPVRTVQMTVFLVTQTVEFIRTAPWQQTQRNLGGPVAIGVMAYKSAQQGLTDYLNLFIAISIILAVMNILPIPILDGGYIAITLVELVIRRPIPQRILAPVLTLFMVLFFILFALLIYNDIRNQILKF